METKKKKTTETGSITILTESTSRSINMYAFDSGASEDIMIYTLTGDIVTYW